MSKIVKFLGLVAVAGTLTACGETVTERGATGAVLGGAVASLTGGNIAEGALIGAAGGAIAPCIANPNLRGCN